MLQAFEMNKKIVVLLIVVALAVVAIATVSMGGEDEADARYNYRIDTTTENLNGSWLESPGEGNYWAILSYTVVNDRYSAGITTNPIMWQWGLSYNNIMYSDDSETCLLKGYALVEVGVGGTATQVLAYKIPSTVPPEGLVAVNKYVDFTTPDLERDESINVPAPDLGIANFPPAA